MYFKLCWYLIIFTDIKNAFILQGPKCEWVCATELQDEKFLWLSVLKNAIKSNIEKWVGLRHQGADFPWQTRQHLFLLQNIQQEREWSSVMDDRRKESDCHNYLCEMNSKKNFDSWNLNFFRYYLRWTIICWNLKCLPGTQLIWVQLLTLYMLGVTQIRSHSHKQNWNKYILYLNFCSVIE